MFVKSRPSWALPESAATPEAHFFNRRGVIKGAGAIAASAVLAACDSKPAKADKPAAASDPSAKLYPAKRNTHFTLDRAITKESIAETYNNYYEFGTQKQIYNEAQALPIRP